MPCKITSVQLTVPAKNSFKYMVVEENCVFISQSLPIFRNGEQTSRVFSRTMFVCSRIIHLMIRRSLFANFANNLVCCKPYYLPSLGGSCDRLQDMWTVEQAGQLIIILLRLSTTTINAHHLIWQLYSSSNNNIDYYIYISLVLLW